MSTWVTLFMYSLVCLSVAYFSPLESKCLAGRDFICLPHCCISSSPVPVTSLAESGCAMPVWWLTHQMTSWFRCPECLRTLFIVPAAWTIYSEQPSCSAVGLKSLKFSQVQKPVISQEISCNFRHFLSFIKIIIRGRWKRIKERAVSACGKSHYSESFGRRVGCLVPDNLPITGRAQAEAQQAPVQGFAKRTVSSGELEIAKSPTIPNLYIFGGGEYLECQICL